MIQGDDTCLGCLYKVESRNAEGCLGLKAISDLVELAASPCPEGLEFPSRGGSPPLSTHRRRSVGRHRARRGLVGQDSHGRGRRRRRICVLPRRRAPSRVPVPQRRVCARERATCLRLSVRIRWRMVPSLLGICALASGRNATGDKHETAESRRRQNIQ